MARLLIVFTVAATLALLPPPRARAADQTILGSSFVVKDPGDPLKRTITAAGKEASSPNTLVGDPQANGATLQIVANGTHSSVQTFTLPAGVAGTGVAGWKPLGKPISGYSYKDSSGVAGPVKAVSIQKSGRGAFVLKVQLKGALGPGPQPHITVVPPATGTDGGIQLAINGGDTYCVSFGGAAGGAVSNSPTGIGTKVFKVASKKTSPTAETGCPTSDVTTTTTSTSSTSTTTTTTSTTTTTTSTTTASTTTTTTLPGPALDLNSPVGTSSSCLTNTSGAQLAVLAILVDTASQPVVGATVTMSATAGTIGPVQSSGNFYFATMTAPAGGTSAQVTVVANGQTLNTKPTVTLAAPFTDTTGGAGGCAQDGNLRVRAVDETGAPVVGASVLVGQSAQANAYVTTVGAPASGPNTATTDAQGYAVFRDFGSTLTGPVTVTAGAVNRAYVTVTGVNASDVVLPLKPIVPSAQTGTITGSMSGIAASTNLRVGVVIGDVSLNALAAFNVNALLADSVCYNTGVVGSQNVPDNVFIPAQTLIVFPIPQKNYDSAPLPYGMRHVTALGGNVLVSALTSGGGVAGALSQLTFTDISAATVPVSTPGPTTVNFTQGAYGSTTACTATGAPGTDAFCIAAMDWDGNTTPTHNVGEGALGLFSFKTAPATGGVVSITDVDYTAKNAGGTNPFTGVGHMGATVSLNLDKTAATIPPGTANGVSVVLKRDFPSDTFPATFAYGAMYPVRVHTQTGRTLALDTPAGLTGAQYVKHTLTQEISTPYSACNPNDSTHTTSNVLWEIYGPISAASLTLPTLPATFPRATLAGNLPGLVDPSATPEDDKVLWTSTTILEGLNPSFDYNHLRFGGFSKYGTKFTTNSADYTP